MSSSRIYIKGLPPTLSDGEFKKHFSTKHEITDAKLIPHRRIGYVGYKTPEDATKAVKYFNKSFMRMSKIGVEIARPISDPTLPISRKEQREQDREVAKFNRIQKPEDVPAEDPKAGQKRKWSDVDEPHLRLKEFLEVMQPASKSTPWAAQSLEDVEPPTKIQAIEIPEADSDQEYEAVPKKPKKKSQAPLELTVPISMEPIIPTKTNNITADLHIPDATDDDWMRNRTNRLLDLMDSADIAVEKSVKLTSKTNAVREVVDKPGVITEKVLGEIEKIEEERGDPVIEAISANGRLFVRNLPYTATEQDLREHFQPYGTLEEVHLACNSAGTSKGFVLIQFKDPVSAADAFHNLDGEPFQGRLLHILPATAKRVNKLDEFAIAKLSLKKQKQIKKKAEASSNTFNWNSLFMNQDAVNSAIADRLGVSKFELLDPTSSDAGVRQAIAETSVIQEAKSYFAKNGVDLDAFKKRERGDTAILVKNFPYGMTLEELRNMFEEFGQVLRILMPPTGTIAIVQLAQPGYAKAAFASLAYRRVKDSVLFLEKAPKDLFTNVSTNVTVVPSDRQGIIPDSKISASDLLQRESALETVDTTTLFVRNLNFATTSDRIIEVFKPLDGFLSARVNTKTDPKKPGQILSMGFGFLEFRSKSQAHAALKAMDGFDLDGHKLVIKLSHKGLDAAEERKNDVRAKKQAYKRTKIIIKNLPFEASKKDVRALFGTYGQLRSVRVPQKFDHSARGFAFADFITAREAENALEALKGTHLLGRRLVLEFASEDSLDAEKEIEKMQKKVGNQVNKVALEKLTGQGRKKFNIQGDDGDED